MAIKCPKCQADNPDTKQFCGDCGTQLPSIKDIGVTKTLETPVQELTRGTTFANRYEIIEELGRGGMGRVYRVDDTKVKEEVALKLIKPEVAAAKRTIERFRNELKSARKIRHKNVCQMFDLGEYEGNHFITMEYVTGEDLKSLIRRVRNIPIDTAVSITKQICEGLIEAHKLGIIHRDLKPSNIMIDKAGNARIMDFGIARSVKSGALTGADVMIGTPDYMSPEQVEGKEIDQRSDIYSLGVVLFEMLTGEKPFKGDTSLSVAMKHKSEAPPNPKWLNDQIPDRLSRLVLMCLEKEKEKRYQSAEELLSALNNINERKLHITDKEERKKSIAVLPFEDMSPEKDQEYFCDGMAEEIINALSHIEKLKVIARTSAFSFKGKHEDVREIGRKLDVETLLEGSVRKAGNRLRIMAQLINVADGSHLWSERYDRNLEDVFEIQDEITQSIVEALRLKLVIGPEAIQEKRHTKKLEAYHLYLKDRYYWYSRHERDLEKAIRHFELAIDEDPSYALPYAGLAESYCFIGGYGYLPPTVAFSKAKTAVERALDIDDSLAEVHAAMGLVRFWGQWDWHGAELEFKRAIDIKPTYVDVYCLYTLLLLVLDRQEEAIAKIKMALELDPFSHFAHAVSGGLPFATRDQYEEGIEHLKRAIQLYPDYIYAHWLLGHIYSLCSMHKEAIATHQKVLALTDRASFYLGSIGMTYGFSGDLDIAEAILHELEERSQREYVPAFAIAHVWAGMKNPDQTLEWLEKAYNERAGMIWMVGMPLWDPFRSDPRFEDLFHRLNLSWKL